MNDHCQLYHEFMEQADIHLSEWHRIQGNINRVQQPGGTCAISEDNWQSLLKNADDEYLMYLEMRALARLADHTYWITEVAARQEESNEYMDMTEQLRHGG